MPTDDTNPITGVDCSVSLLLDGVAQKKAKIEKFDVEMVTQTTESRPLGSTGVHVDVIQDGWKGSFEVHERNSAMDDLIDAYLLAKRTRVPISLVLTQSKVYKDQTTSIKTYINVQIPGFSASYERGSNVRQKFDWRSGDDRL